jgi:hypothetical protein
MRGAQKMMEMIMRTLTLTLATLAAAAALAGSAQAQNSGPSSGAYASPPRPIPHSQLDAYLRASPRERATRDWWAELPAATAAQAATSTAVNAQASSSLPSQVRPTTPAPAPNRPSLSTTSPRSDSDAAVRGPTQARPGVTGGPSSGAGQGIPVRP